MKRAILALAVFLLAILLLACISTPTVEEAVQIGKATVRAETTLTANAAVATLEARVTERAVKTQATNDAVLPPR